MVAAGVGGLAGSAAALNVDDDTVIVSSSDRIQEGIDNATQNDSIDTVQIEEGEYTLSNSVVIDGSGATGLTVESAGDRSNTTITYEADNGTPAFAADAEGVTIRGLTIERGGESSTVAQGVRVAASSVEVSDNVINSTNNNDQTDNGILVTDQDSNGDPVENNVTGVTLTGNNVNGFPVGIATATQTSEDTVQDLTISSNKLNNNGVGVGFSERDGAAALGDEIDVTGNTLDGNGVGVYIFGDEVPCFAA
ncbi:hypothetical protein GCM10028858_22170 [Halorubrum pallidum]